MWEREWVWEVVWVRARYAACEEWRLRMRRLVMTLERATVKPIGISITVICGE